ncbi:MAG: hypothetical protein JSU91_01850 [Thermoplasmatales archaeon]|nr:MAG: hypothetical protein JSU91_01850 [Thermoplasmatales archaeon]
MTLIGKFKNLIKKALVTLDRTDEFGQCSYLGTTSNYESIKPYGFASIPKQSDKPLVIMLNVLGSEENKVGVEYNNKLKFTEEELLAGEVVVFNPTSTNYVIFKNDGQTKLVGKKIALGNSTTELLDEIVNILDKIITHTHASVMGATSAPNNAAQFTAIKNLIDAIKGTI